MRIEKPSVADTALEEQKNLPPQPLGKVIVAGVVAVASQGALWLLVSQLFGTGTGVSFDWAGLASLIFALCAFVVMLALFGFAAAVIRNPIAFLLIASAGSLTHLVFFPISLSSIIVALLMLTGLILWKGQISADLRNRISFSATTALNAGLAGMITFSLLAVSVAYYGYLTQQEGSNLLISGVVEAATESVNKILPRYVPGYDPSMTLDDFLRRSTTSAVQPSDPTVGISPIDSAIREGLDAAEGQLLAESRRQFLDTFGIQGEGTDTMGDIVARAAARRIEGALEPYKKFIPAILALSLFFILRIFGIVYSMLARLFSAAVFGVLRAVGFTTIRKVLVEKEHVDFA